MIRKHIVYNKFSNWRFNVLKAQGSCLWDERGRRLIDFTSGWNVANLGWNHPEIHEAVRMQLKKNSYVPGWISDHVQEEYAEALVASLPKELDSICRATGGTEANEEALKIAWVATGRKKIISFSPSYHGQSLAAVHLGYPAEFLKKQVH